jgi:chemotaxis protein MotB
MPEDEKYFDEDEPEGGNDEEAPAWLTSYSDMMTDLLAIFVILFSFAMMAVSQQNYSIRTELEKSKQAAAGSASVAQETVSGTASQAANQAASKDFDEIYESIQKKINQSGYSESILLEKGEGFIKFRFKDNVLFYPDSPTMRESSFDILQYMGGLLLSVDDQIGSIEISGHTAMAGDESQNNYFAWELSSDRAIAVLKFFSSKCDLPQSKMIVSGYSYYHPVAGNEAEEGRSQNRRVEVKINQTGSSSDKMAGFAEDEIH